MVHIHLPRQQNNFLVTVVDRYLGLKQSAIGAMKIANTSFIAYGAAV